MRILFLGCFKNLFFQVLHQCRHAGNLANLYMLKSHDPSMSSFLFPSVFPYGANNNQRLTGLHETQSIDQFSYGVSDRGASIRIPVGTIDGGWKGRLEDRRPASNGDPYKIAAVIIKTTKKALA